MKAEARAIYNNPTMADARSKNYISFMRCLAACHYTLMRVAKSLMAVRNRCYIQGCRGH
jgi:hypothetical protein